MSDFYMKCTLAENLLRFFCLLDIMEDWSYYFQVLSYLVLTDVINTLLWVPNPTNNKNLPSVRTIASTSAQYNVI